MHDYTDLEVWNRAAQLTLEVYGATASFPKEQIAGITLKIRRVSSRISASIAEACMRDDEAEFPGFLLISMSFVRELEELLQTAHDLAYLKPTDHARLAKELAEIKEMLSSLIQKLRADR